MYPKNHSLALAVKIVLGVSMSGASLPVDAEDADERTAQHQVAAVPATSNDGIIATVSVSALAIDGPPEHLASTFSLLEGRRLLERTQATLGDTLDGQPGVHSDTFGGGATRPIIRGQTAPRVKVLSDGVSLLDAAAISPDHAITSEPFLLRKVEILRGPATLLYGSGAIGGVVNTLDKKIPTVMPKNGFEGSLAVRGASVSRERAAMAEVTAQATENLAVHAEGAIRDADAYRARGWPESRVDGTQAESGSGSLGLSWIGESGYLGLAYSYRDDGYGLPGHSHEYEGCHPHDSSLHCGGHDHTPGEPDHDHDHEHGGAPTVALLSKRLELRGEINDPFAGIERIRIRTGDTDYRHHELDDGEIATTFRNAGHEARVEVQHAPLLGWRGAVGMQYASNKFSALGEEAFIPTSDSRTLGLFVVEHFELNEAWHFEAGARHEWQRHQPLNDERKRPKFSDTAVSLSAAAIWEVVPEYLLTLSAARSERLPQAQELYARGVHLATNTYECGLVAHPLTCGGAGNNADIRTEISNNVELALRKSTGRLTFGISAFHNQVDNYIHARTLDQYETFRLIKYTQRDATFTGAEAEVSYQLTGNVAVTLFGDHVRARFAGGGNLPRIPATRYGTRLNASAGNHAAELEYYRVDRQDDVAGYEMPTPGYHMLNLTLSYDVPTTSYGSVGYSMYLRGSNLLDQEVWNHASFLANVVPMPGRGVSAGIKVSF